MGKIKNILIYHFISWCSLQVFYLYRTYLCWALISFCKDLSISFLNLLKGSVVIILCYQGLFAVVFSKVFAYTSSLFFVIPIVSIRHQNAIAILALQGWLLSPYSLIPFNYLFPPISSLGCSQCLLLISKFLRHLKIRLLHEIDLSLWHGREIEHNMLETFICISFLTFLS